MADRARGLAGDEPIKRKGNIKQSVSRWCYQKFRWSSFANMAPKLA